MAQGLLADAVANADTADEAEARLGHSTIHPSGGGCAYIKGCRSDTVENITEP